MQFIETLDGEFINAALVRKFYLTKDKANNTVVVAVDDLDETYDIEAFKTNDEAQTWLKGLLEELEQ